MPQEWRGKQQNNTDLLLEVARKNWYDVLGILQSPEKAQKIKIVKTFVKITTDNNIITGIEHRWINYIELTLLIISRVHSKSASNIFGISVVIVPLSLFTVVAIVDNTSGSRADGTVQR